MSALSFNDADDLAAIHQDCFIKGWSKQDFQKMLSDKGLFGFISDNRQGFILCRKVLDEAEIYTVCVKKTYQGQGVGFALLQQALEYAKANGINKMFLEVNEYNTPALKIYTKAGFQQIGIRKNYYTTQTHNASSAPENAVIMEKVIY